MCLCVCMHVSVWFGTRDDVAKIYHEYIFQILPHSVHFWNMAQWLLSLHNFVGITLMPQDRYLVIYIYIYITP